MATPVCPQGLWCRDFQSQKAKAVQGTGRRGFLLWESRHCGTGLPREVVPSHSWRFSRTAGVNCAACSDFRADPASGWTGDLLRSLVAWITLQSSEERGKGARKPFYARWARCVWKDQGCWHAVSPTQATWMLRHPKGSQVVFIMTWGLKPLNFPCWSDCH